MEPEGSLPHSQQPATCPYPERGTHNQMRTQNISLGGGGADPDAIYNLSLI
jgi:hypothetical protein